jgi:hypothetical protein
MGLLPGHPHYLQTTKIKITPFINAVLGFRKAKK